jgi:hypothetical protein
MLDDAAIERFSRQILLPEVGGQGQERLCATSATVRGAGNAAGFAATLLAAAGLQVERDDRPLDGVAVGCAGGTVVGRARGAAAVVATLVGRPCIRCVPDSIWDLPDAAGDRPAPADQAFGALLGAEALRVALRLATTGRIQAIDLGRGTFGARPLPASGGCPACTGAAAAS